MRKVNPLKSGEQMNKKATKKKPMPLSQVYRLLEPGPVVLVTTTYKGKANIMTMSWHTMMEFEPPLVGCIISNRNHSFKALTLTKECVINIPTSNLAKVVVGCGNTSGKKIEKFSTFNLTPVPSDIVKAPRIEECYANLECKIIDSKMANKYNFFVLEVLKAWCNSSLKQPKMLHHQGKGIFVIDGKKIKLPSKMK